jgi:ribosomal protein L29
MSTKKTPITELQRMTPAELRRELLIKRAEVAKMRIGIEMQSEKNHALYHQNKKEIARMTMVLKGMERGTVPVPAAAPAAPAKAETPVKKASQSAKKSVKSSGSRAKKK